MFPLTLAYSATPGANRQKSAAVYMLQLPSILRHGLALRVDKQEMGSLMLILEEFLPQVLTPGIFMSKNTAYYTRNAHVNHDVLYENIFLLGVTDKNMSCVFFFIDTSP